MQLRLLCVGDVVGQPGRQVLAEQLHRVVKEHEVDCVIVNAENAAGGSGLNPTIYRKLHTYGVNLVTLGDHIYRKREIVEVLENADDIVRPANLTPQASGREFALFSTQKGPQVAVISLLGRMFMPVPSDNPFVAVDRVLNRLHNQTSVIVVDVHAEATSEKIAMGRYLDGRVSAVFGTHTHVTTADETVLPRGTAYITDVGMTGPHDSVLGRNTERVLKNLTTQMPSTFSIATGDVRINGLLVTVDSNTGLAVSAERLCVKAGETRHAAYNSDDGRAGVPRM